MGLGCFELGGLNPRFIFYDTFYYMNWNSKLFRKLFFGYYPRNVRCSDLVCNFLSYCRPSVMFAFVVSGCEPALGNHVLGVLFSSSGKKMIGVYALTKVTFMENKVSFWNRPSVENPRCDVGTNAASESTSSSDRSIRPLVIPYPSSPNPTWSKRLNVNWSRFVHPRPKSLRESFGIALINEILRCSCWLHNQLVWLCRAPSAITRRGILVYYPHSV